jgi:hypothetical protein
MKKRVVWKAAEIVVGQSSAGRKRERHAFSIATIAGAPGYRFTGFPYTSIRPTFT